MAICQHCGLVRRPAVSVASLLADARELTDEQLHELRGLLADLANERAKGDR